MALPIYSFRGNILSDLMGTWLTLLLPIILFLVCAFLLADQMNLESAMNKVAEACSPQQFSLKVENRIGCLPLFLMVLATGVLSIFVYRLWYVGWGLPLAVFLAAAFIFLGLPAAVLLAGSFMAIFLEEWWPRSYKDRIKLMLARQKEKYAKAGDTKKEAELGRILDSWDVPASPLPSVAPAGTAISIGAPPAVEKVSMRERLQRLENAKDSVLKLLESETHLDESTKKTWVSDAKEVYYTTLAAS